jgi:hypothetical protein
MKKSLCRTYIATKDYISITEACIKIQPSPIKATKIERKFILHTKGSLWYSRSDKGVRKQLWQFASAPHTAFVCVHALYGVFEVDRYMDKQKSIRKVMPDIHRPAMGKTLVSWLDV